ncbi:hypothetical protein WH7805_13898 [Synechococcus sp. WH 7805]|nr:hypothetical protein WH7805_13898 [Synechococcus sp. WH 7805]
MVDTGRIQTNISVMRQQTIQWILIPASLALVGLLIGFIALIRCESQLQFLPGRSDDPACIEGVP